MRSCSPVLTLQLRVVCLHPHGTPGRRDPALGPQLPFGGTILLQVIQRPQDFNRALVHSVHRLTTSLRTRAPTLVRSPPQTAWRKEKGAEEKRKRGTPTPSPRMGCDCICMVSSLG